MAIDFKVPDLGENVEAGDIVNVMVKEGDEIQAEQNVMEIETGKAVVELPCPHRRTDHQGPRAEGLEGQSRRSAADGRSGRRQQPKDKPEAKPADGQSREARSQVEPSRPRQPAAEAAASQSRRNRRSLPAAAEAGLPRPTAAPAEAGHARQDAARRAGHAPAGARAGRRSGARRRAAGRTAGSPKTTSRRPCARHAAAPAATNRATPSAPLPDGVDREGLLGTGPPAEDVGHSQDDRRQHGPLVDRRFRTSPTSTTPTSPSWSGSAKAGWPTTSAPRSS